MKKLTRATAVVGLSLALVGGMTGIATAATASELLAAGGAPTTTQAAVGTIQGADGGPITHATVTIDGRTYHANSGSVSIETPEGPNGPQSWIVSIKTPKLTSLSFTLKDSAITNVHFDQSNVKNPMGVTNNNSFLLSGTASNTGDQFSVSANFN